MDYNLSRKQMQNWVGVFAISAASCFLLGWKMNYCNVQAADYPMFLDGKLSPYVMYVRYIDDK